MIIAEIVLTGGPCGGKTTALDILCAEFTSRGYRVITAPEVASIFIGSGFGDIDSLEKHNPKAYFGLETSMFAVQRLLRSSLHSIANALPSEKAIILYDRAELDAQAYVDKKKFLALMDCFDVTEDMIFAQYNLVLHLTTAAAGAEKFYCLDNPNRRESDLESARAADRRTMEAWLGHPNHVIIDNQNDFNMKMTTVIKEIERVISND